MDKPTAARPSPTTGVTGRRHVIVMYVAAVSLYWVALYLYVPTLPTYAESKSDTLALVGVVLSMYGLWQAIIRLPLGIASDWLGRRKPFIVVGFALAGLGAWTMGAADGVRGLIVGRAITGLAAGAWVPLIVVFSSLFPPHESVRASAILTLIGSLARVLATGVTGTLNDWGGHSLAFFLAAGAAALAVLFVLPGRERVRPPQRPSVRGIGRLILRRDVLLPSLISAVNQYANWAITFGFMPLLAERLGATDVAQSMLVSMNLGVLTLGNLMAAAIVNRIGARQLVRFGFVLLSIGIGGAALASSLPLLFVSQFCIGLATGVSYPLLMGMSIRHVAEKERTTAMGLHQSVYAIGMFSGPWLSGLLADAMGMRPMFGVTAGFCLIVGLLLSRGLAVDRSA